VSPKRRNFALAPFLPYAYFRATENIFTVIEPGIVFRGYDVCFCNLLSEANNFGLGVSLLSCLISMLQEQPSPEIDFRTLFSEF
jgi:hypothetical protein